MLEIAQMKKSTYRKDGMEVSFEVTKPPFSLDNSKFRRFFRVGILRREGNS